MAMLFALQEDGKTQPEKVTKHTELALGFETFNPLQSRFAKERLHQKDCNIVCTWKTGTGKTVCAQLICEVALKQGRKVIYACPLKALAEEKVRELRSLFPDKSIEVFTGDYTDVENRREKAIKADIAVVTTELLDSVSRTRLLSDVLLRNCQAVISDEAHIIATDRGPALEGALIRISAFNPAVRHILLSATAPNAEELAAWVRDLNGKDTYVLTSNWRPVTIRWHVIQVKPSRPRKEWRRAAVDRAIALIRMLLSSEPDSQILLFVWTKGEGRLLTERLTKAGISSAFHNAELELKERLSLEEAFDTGAVRVLVSTTTLAWGRNTNARHVILFGERRGMDYVEGWDILQAGGRAGRVGRANKGDVWFLVSNMEHAADILGDPPRITSRLVKPSPLAFQVLGEIPYRGHATMQVLSAWYRKTFAARCLDRDTQPGQLLGDALQILQRTGCAFQDQIGRISLTGLGIVARRFYVRPEEIHCLAAVLKKIINAGPAKNEKDNLDLFSILFTAHSASSTKQLFLSRQERIELETSHAEQWRNRYRDLLLEDIHAFVAYGLKTWHFFHSQNPEHPLPYKLREFVYDMQRISTVCREIAKTVLHAPHSFLDSMDSMALVLSYGAPIEARELLAITGIGAKRAIQLLKLGIKNEKELIQAVQRGEKSVFRIVPRSLIESLSREHDLRAEGSSPA